MISHGKVPFISPTQSEKEQGKGGKKIFMTHFYYTFLSRPAASLVVDVVLTDHAIIIIIMSETGGIPSNTQRCCFALCLLLSFSCIKHAFAPSLLSSLAAVPLVHQRRGRSSSYFHFPVRLLGLRVQLPFLPTLTRNAVSPSLFIRECSFTAIRFPLSYT